MISQVDTIAALRLDDPGTEGVRFVKGHSTAGDDGGGIFEWHSTSTKTDDAGTVIQVTGVSTGRWVRQVDVQGPFHAEWFGAKGDGTTDDVAAIQKCLDTFGRVSLLAKTYVISTGRILLKSNDVVEGQGMDKTTILFKWNPNENWKVPAFYNLLLTATDDAVIRDLTVDCWFNSSTRKNTRSAISLKGERNLVERVKAVNFGVGFTPADGETPASSPGECFPIFLLTTVSNGLLGTIKDCIITQPGTHPTLPLPEDLPEDWGWPEISALMVMGGGKTDPEPPDQPVPVVGRGGLIVGNRIHDLPYDTTTSGAFQPSPIHAITVGACIGTEVSENEAINCDGVGVYLATWTDRDVVIRANRLMTVHKGVFVGIQAGELASFPSHQRTQITDNVIILGRIKAPAAGMQLWGMQVFASSGYAADPSRLQDILIARNYIRGEQVHIGQETLYPAGIVFGLNSKVFEGIRVQDNIIEVPDPPPGGTYTFGVPNEYGITFYPVTEYVASANTILLHNNRNMAGQAIRLKQTGSSPFKSWGPYSIREFSFRSPVFDGAARCYYDEFLGQLPASHLGWANLSSNGGGIAAVNGQDGRPGIVQLSTGTAGNGVGMLMCRTNSIKLGGGVSHVVQFSCSRVAEDSVAEWRAGFMQSSGNAGAYFKYGKSAGSTAGSLAFVCRKCSGTEKVYVLMTNADVNANWFTYRIEVSSDGSQIQVFRSRLILKDAILVDSLVPELLEVCKEQIPTDCELGCGFKIIQDGETQSRLLQVDYFQHELV